MNHLRALENIVVVWVCVLFLSSIVSQAAESTDNSKKTSEFYLEKGLVDRIYAATLNDEKEKTRANTLGMGVGVSLLSPKQLVLSNSYYSVSWASAGETYPMPFVSMGSSLVDWNWLSLGWTGRVGYSYREGLYSLKLKTGISTSQDFLRMHWASALARLDLAFSVSEWIRPVLFGGLGGQWIFQVGRLDGVNQSFLIPTYATGAELVFFDRSQSDHWFSGARIGVSYISAFASHQSLSLLGFDFGASFIF